MSRVSTCALAPTLPYLEGPWVRCQPLPPGAQGTLDPGSPVPSPSWFSHGKDGRDTRRCRAGLPSTAGRRKEPGVRDPLGLRGALAGTRCSVCRLTRVVAEPEGQMCRKDGQTCPGFLAAERVRVQPGSW